MRLTALTPVLLLSLACGCSDSTGGGSPDLSGTWSYSDSISSTAGAVVDCSLSGTATLTQSGTTLTGTIVTTQGRCTDAFGASIDNTGTLELAGGQIDGDQVSFSFQVPICQLSGTISGSNSMSGSESCTRAIGAQVLAFTGTWQASR